MIYQHVVAQDNAGDHEIKVEWSTKAGGRICTVCKKRVAQYGDDVGPESLRAMFPLPPVPRGRR